MHTLSPMSGDWRMEKAASKRHPPAAIRSGTLGSWQPPPELRGKGQAAPVAGGGLGWLGGGAGGLSRGCLWHSSATDTKPTHQPEGALLQVCL